MFNVKIGISDHHGIIVTALKSEFIKGDPKTRHYRDNKNFDTEAFKQDLL